MLKLKVKSNRSAINDRTDADYDVNACNANRFRKLIPN